MLEFLVALPVLLFSVVAHEYAHGYAALRQGDPTAAQAGRLTLNPLKHIDPWMSVLLPAMLWFGTDGRFVFGGAKPVPVDPRNYRRFRTGDLIVSSAGILTNLALLGLCTGLSIVVGLLGGAAPAMAPGLATLQRMFYWGIWLNALLACFNLIPIPPLDGAHILYHFLPAPLAHRFRQLFRYGFLILLVMIVFFRDLFFWLLLPAIMLTRLALSVAAGFALQPLPF